MRICVLLCAASMGCALLGKNEPVVPRYFTAEYETPQAKAAPHPELRLRIGRISAWAHLRERLVVRSSAQEVTFAEDRRWTERPEVYLKSALEHALFEERGLVEAQSGAGATLDVALARFEEVQGPRPHARLRALVSLHDDRTGRLEETITIDEEIAAGADRDVAVVEALSRALRAGVNDIADRVVGKLVAMAGETK